MLNHHEYIIAHINQEFPFSQEKFPDASGVTRDGSNVILFLDLDSGKLLAFPYLEMTCWHVCMEYVLQPYQVCLLERKCDQFVVNGMITMIFKTGNLENFQLPSF